MCKYSVRKTAETVSIFPENMNRRKIKIVFIFESLLDNIFKALFKVQNKRQNTENNNFYNKNVAFNNGFDVIYKQKEIRIII